MIFFTIFSPSRMLILGKVRLTKENSPAVIDIGLRKIYFYRCTLEIPERMGYIEFLYF